MSELEMRIKDLEDNIDQLNIDLHASRIAITILTTCFNSMAKEPGLLAKGYEKAMKEARPIKFDYPAPEGYEEQLHQKVMLLLSSTES
ncbi:hypothetical protein QMG90_07985 [Trabulsiella odontotermitis]|uniref:hypothetical protein n=1 Tax=Trabulsiella odontotermitis TaxID=379893 RepID=UPI0024B7A7B4|nr:hypothetical protein [Trabulsiella odontotermitis]WHP32828.1 hypothetical protein QMG90_07985 [Trabulsiella odontotermitis]